MSGFKRRAVFAALQFITTIAIFLPSAFAQFPYSPPEGHIRIMTFNIQAVNNREEWGGPRTPAELTLLAQRLVSFEADIIGCQEIKEESAFNDIATQMGSEWAWFSQGAGTDTHTAFLYNQDRVELLEDDTLYQLPEAPFTPWPSSHFDGVPMVGLFQPSVAGSLPVRVINVHLQSGLSSQNSTDRTNQTNYIRDLVSHYRSIDSSKSPLAVLGDFNMIGTDSNFSILEQGNLLTRLLKRNGTVTWNVNNFELDHILVLSGLLTRVDQADCYVVRENDYSDTLDDWRRIYSDHYPVFIDLDVRGLNWTRDWAMYE